MSVYISKLTRNKISPELFVFFIVIALWGFGGSIYDTIFNNFLNETYSLSSLNRTLLELPRELPGLLTIFITAALFFFCSRRLASLSLIIAGAGLFAIGFFSFNYSVMIIWLFIYSMGQHLFMPLNSSIGMEMAEKGQTGKRLGEINGIRNLAVILGSFVVFIGFKFFNFDFKIAFLIGAIALILSGLLLLRLKKGEAKPPLTHLKLHKEYSLYYGLSILFGTRKQIFLTFAPWVLVTVFGKSTQVVASIMTIGGVIGIIFQPFLGKMIDKLGERKILMIEGFALIFVCFGYGYSKILFSGETSFYIAAICYLLDQLLFSFGIARSTYLKKIAVREEDISSTLAMAVSMDHFFSISIALIGGILWACLGYQVVFLGGSLIALTYMLVASRIKYTDK